VAKGKRDLLNVTAENIGAALGRLASRVDQWKKQRSEIAADIEHVIQEAQSMLKDVSHEPTPTGIASIAEVAHPPVHHRKLSAAARRRISQAARRRWAEKKAALLKTP